MMALSHTVKGELWGIRGCMERGDVVAALPALDRVIAALRGAPSLLGPEIPAAVKLDYILILLLTEDYLN